MPSVAGACGRPTTGRSKLFGASTRAQETETFAGLNCQGLFQEQRSRVSLQLRLSGGGKWIRTLDTLFVTCSGFPRRHPNKSGWSLTSELRRQGWSVAKAKELTVKITYPQ